MLVSDLIPSIPPQETTSSSAAGGKQPGGGASRSHLHHKSQNTLRRKSQFEKLARAHDLPPLAPPPVKRLCLPGRGRVGASASVLKLGLIPTLGFRPLQCGFRGPNSTPELFPFFTDEKTCSTSTCETETRYRLSFLVVLPRWASCDHGSVAGWMAYSISPTRRSHLYGSRCSGGEEERGNSRVVVQGVKQMPLAHRHFVN